MDVAIVTTALLLRLTAIAWSLVLLARVRDGWIACVTAIFAIMTVRLAGSVVLGDGTWEIAGPGPLTNLGQLATSALMVAAAGFLDRTLTDRDRAQRALEKTQRELERRVEDRTASLRESETKFRQLADHIDAAFWLGDLQTNRTLYVSAGFEKLFGCTYDALGGSTDAWIDSVHPDDRDRVTRAYRRTLAGSGFDEEFRILRPDGTMRWVRDQGFLVANGASQPHVMAGLVSDITNSKEIEEALRDSNEELEVFAQTISHDLKAPLRAMEKFAVTVKEEYGGKLDDRARSYLSLIAEGAARLDSLLNDLLQHARLGRSIATERIDLAAVVARVLEDLQPQIRERNAIIECADDLPSLLGHRSLLETCVQNLLTNALKFVPAERTPHIEIGLRSDEAAHHLFVRDNGIGIEASHHERIFAVFERLHPRETYPGTGIGLAIVKKAARLHGGDASVESSPGQGSTFRLTLPRHADETAGSGEVAA